MLVSYINCESCIHAEVCNRRDEYDSLSDKIKNVDKKKPYTGYAIKIECTNYRPDGISNDKTYIYAIRG
jgi:hypothetical protein